MARPKKIGLDYFPMDVRLDQKFEALERLHKAKGFVWIIKFWQKAYQSEDGCVDLNGIFGVIQAENSWITPGEQKAIIKDSLKIGLLIEKSQGVYTSNGIQKRIAKIRDEREKDRKRRGIELSDSYPPENRGETGETETETETERKEKEKKEDSSGASAPLRPRPKTHKQILVEEISSKTYPDYQEAFLKKYPGREPSRQETWRSALNELPETSLDAEQVRRAINGWYWQHWQDKDHKYGAPTWIVGKPRPNGEIKNCLLENVEYYETHKQGVTSAN